MKILVGLIPDFSAVFGETIQSMKEYLRRSGTLCSIHGYD